MRKVLAFVLTAIMILSAVFPVSAVSVKYSENGQYGTTYDYEVVVTQGFEEDSSSATQGGGGSGTAARRTEAQGAVVRTGLYSLTLYDIIGKARALRIPNIFPNISVDKKYRVSFWFYARSEDFVPDDPESSDPPSVKIVPAAYNPGNVNSVKPLGTCDIVLDTWNEIVVEYTVTSDGQSGLQFSHSSSSNGYVKNFYIDDLVIEEWTLVPNIVSWLSYQDMESITSGDNPNADAVAAGGAIVNFADTAYNHTPEGKKSVRIRNRDNPYKGVKFYNMFNQATKTEIAGAVGWEAFRREDVGRRFLIEAWVYAPKAQGARFGSDLATLIDESTLDELYPDSKPLVSIGMFAPGGFKYATSPYGSREHHYIDWNTWTKITFIHEVKDDNIDNGQTPSENTLVNAIRIDSAGADDRDVLYPDYLYVDDLTVTELERSTPAEPFIVTDMQIEGDIEANSTITVTKTIENVTLEDVDAVMLLAVYGPDGNMLDVSIGERVTLSRLQPTPVSAELTLGSDFSLADGYYIKILIWEDLSNIKPILPADTIDHTTNPLARTIKPAPFGLPISVAEAKQERRSVPVSDIKGQSYDELIFYEKEFDDNNEWKILDQIFNTLPDGRTVFNNDKFMASYVHGTKFGQASKISVSDMPFPEAWRIVVNQIPPGNPWDFQIEPSDLNEGTDYKDGDAMLLILYMRTISAEAGKGKIQCIVEQNVAPNSKALSAYASVIEGEGWRKIYMPFTAKAGYSRVRIRLGYAVQTIEIGGFEIINYEDKVAVEELPQSSIMEFYDGKTVFIKDEQWRKDAWERIEQIRKGDITVIVKDAAGNPVSGARVNISMYEHEFQWGSMLNFNNVNVSKPENINKYKVAASILFNGGVLENALKWNEYEKSGGASRARMQIDTAKALNIKYLRGHTLMWDRAFPNGWVSNTSIPQDVYELFVADDKEGLDQRIRNHILRITGEFDGELREWDVLNEALGNKAIRTKYGNEVVKDWFDWAREGSPTAKLYINETGITGVNQERMDEFKMLLDDMVEAGVDFDGIGIQGHFGNKIVHPMDFYNALTQLAEYGKEMKVTEFDVGLAVGLMDREYEASFMRDIMIVAFSLENVNGFFIWGFWSGFHWLHNAPIFNEDWTLKESGRQYIDLVYNKWWTRENGYTDADGKYSIRGYYGDYDISVVTPDGKIKTVEAQCYKNRENTIIITMD